MANWFNKYNKEVKTQIDDLNSKFELVEKLLNKLVDNNEAKEKPETSKIPSKPILTKPIPTKVTPKREQRTGRGITLSDGAYKIFKDISNDALFVPWTPRKLEKWIEKGTHKYLNWKQFEDYLCYSHLHPMKYGNANVAIKYFLIDHFKNTQVMHIHDLLVEDLLTERNVGVSTVRYINECLKVVGYSLKDPKNIIEKFTTSDAEDEDVDE